MLCCDNLTPLHIAFNSIFHERIKHIEVDYHFTRKKLKFGDIISDGFVSPFLRFLLRNAEAPWFDGGTKLS